MPYSGFILFGTLCLLMEVTIPHTTIARVIPYIPDMVKTYSTILDLR